MHKFHAEASDSAVAVFEEKITFPAYADIHHMRRKISDFIHTTGNTPAYADKINLAVSEALTNLIKHPPVKATQVIVSVRVSNGKTEVDIADDSTPFASFDAKCKTAPAALKAGSTLAESGYGLGCILATHTHAFYTPATLSSDGLNHLRLSDQRDKRKVIFLIDDDPFVLKAHHRMLSGDYDVVPLQSALEALTLFETSRPDLIISDLQMPVMDGATLRRRMSQLPGGDSVPFIFLSALHTQSGDDKLLRLGIDDFLCKPVTEERLLATTSRLLQRAGQMRTALQGDFHRDLDSFLKPALPETYGRWHIHVDNLMADAGGGDFTMFRETGKSLTIFLADVMGHGPRAKFFAYAYAGYIRGLLGAGKQQPSELLTALARALGDDPALADIVLSCQAVEIFPDGRVDIASAGHPPPAHVGGDGSLRRVDVAGALPALGGDYSCITHRMSDGEKLLLGTDGFWDTLHDPPESATPWQDFLKHHKSADDATLITLSFGGKP